MTENIKHSRCSIHGLGRRSNPEDSRVVRVLPPTRRKEFQLVSGYRGRPSLLVVSLFFIFLNYKNCLAQEKPLSFDDVSWVELTDEKRIAHLQRLTELVTTNAENCKTWQGRIGFSQSHIVSGDIAPVIEKNDESDEVFREIEGNGNFVTRLNEDELYSQCEVTERYYTLDSHEIIGANSYPGAMSVILRKEEQESLWHEPKIESQRVAGHSETQPEIRTGRGAFRRDSFHFGISQSFNGAVLDPRRMMKVFGIPTNEFFLGVITEFETASTQSSMIHIEVGSIEASDLTRLSLRSESREAVYIMSEEAWGNVIYAEVMSSADSSIISHEWVISYDIFSGVALPTTCEYTQIDTKGRQRFRRHSTVTTETINANIDDDQFTWKAFGPVPGELVYDALEKKRYVFNDDLNLIEVSPSLLKGEKKIVYEPLVPEDSTLHWLLFLNLGVAIAIFAIVLVLRWRRQKSLKI